MLNCAIRIWCKQASISCSLPIFYRSISKPLPLHTTKKCGESSNARRSLTHGETLFASVICKFDEPRTPHDSKGRMQQKRAYSTHLAAEPGHEHGKRKGNGRVSKVAEKFAPLLYLFVRTMSRSALHAERRCRYARAPSFSEICKSWSLLCGGPESGVVLVL